MFSYVWYFTGKRVIFPSQQYNRFCLVVLQEKEIDAFFLLSFFLEVKIKIYLSLMFKNFMLIERWMCNNAELLSTSSENVFLQSCIQQNYSEVTSTLQEIVILRSQTLVVVTCGNSRYNVEIHQCCGARQQKSGRNVHGVDYIEPESEQGDCGGFYGTGFMA